MSFEKLLSENKFAVERFVHFKISDYEDAEDVIQEIYVTAFQKFKDLSSVSKFKAWIICIAKNKCNDYYRKKAGEIEFTDFDLNLITYEQNKFGITEPSDVFEIICSLNDKSRQILYMYYYLELSQEEIACRLTVPLGTVKSRLYYAKQKVKEKYPYRPIKKGDTIMNKLPNKLPDYTIKKSEKQSFETLCQELMGWLIVPKLNEKICWALYELPSRNKTQYVEAEVVGIAEVHTVQGVEISAKEYNPIDSEKIDNELLSERSFVAQLTDSHCRFLAESHKIEGVKKLYTFLDGEEFTRNWGYGKDNCGRETHIFCKNLIKANKNNYETNENCVDVIGRYIVTIGNMEFDTICVMDIETYDNGVVTQQYIDKNGRTILWCRFNADDWKFEKYGKRWSEILPDNDQIVVNGKTYVHWYDCISDYIF